MDSQQKKLPLPIEEVIADCQEQDGILISEHLLTMGDQSCAFNALCTDMLKRLMFMDSVEEIEQIRALGPSFASDLRQSSLLANRLRLKLRPIPLGDPLFEVLKFLSRKTLYHSVQLINRRVHAIVSQRDAYWPRFEFHRMQMFGDDEIKRTAKVFLFKNAIQLKVPPAELSAIFTSLSTKVNFDDSDHNKLTDPIELVVHHSKNAENGRPDSVYFFIDVDESDEEEGQNADQQFNVRCAGGTKFFFCLPNPLRTKMALSNCLWLFREFSKAHFCSVHFELYRLSDALRSLLCHFDHLRPRRHCLPLRCHSLQSFHPLSVNLLQLFVCPSDRVSVWDLHGTVEFFRYLVDGQQNARAESPTAAENGTNSSNGHRTPDRFNAWGFVPQTVAIPSTDAFPSISATEELSFFDALIHYARLTKCPNKIVRRICLNFKQNPSPWPRIVPGMRLINRTQTFQVDEEAEEGGDDDVEKESVELRYRVFGVANAAKFEVRIECEPARVNEEMYSFELIREEEKSSR